MALTPEDGTGLAAADTYISLADAETYVTAFEPEGKATWDGLSTAQKEVALRKATQWLDTTYVLRWKGSRINSTMSLDWPRKNVIAEGASLVTTAVPVRIEQATVEAATRFASADLVLDVAAGVGDIQSESKELGPLKKRTNYAGTKSTQKLVPKIENILRTLVHGSNRLQLA